MKIYEIINSILELNEDIAISEFINKCIECSKSKNIDLKIINWFVDLKLTIEDELKLYSESHNFSFKTIIHKNYIVKENDCIYVKLGTGQLKYKDVILTIFLPTESNPKSLLIQRSFY